MLLYSDEEAVRLYAAQLLGVVLCYAPPTLVVDTIMSFTSRLDSDVSSPPLTLPNPPFF